MKPGALLLLIAAACVLAMAWTPISDPDVDFHLALGREIARTHAVPQTNVMGYTIPEAKWGSHEWLGSLLIYGIWRVGGTKGVTLFTALLATALFAGGALAARRMAGAGPEGAGWPFALILAWVFPLAAWTARPRLVARPLLLSAALEALLLLFLANYERRTFRRLLLWLAPIFILWWNLHAGYIYGLLILAGTIVGDALEPGRRAAARRLLAAAGIAILASFLIAWALNPASPRSLLFPWTMFRSPTFSRIIGEFERTRLSREPSFLVLLASGIAGLAGSWLRGRRPRAAHVLLFAGFGGLAIARYRMLLEFSVISAPIAAAYLAGAMKSPHDGTRAVRRRFALSALAGAALIALTAWRIGAAESVPFGSGFDPRTHPDAAFDFIEREHIPERIFVNDNWSGPYLRRFYPERRAFIYNQLDVYQEDFWTREYLPILGAAPGWSDTLARYGVNALLLRYSGSGYLQAIGRAAFQDPGWALVYWDDLTMIYVRNTPADAALIAARGLHELDPESPDLAGLARAGHGAGAAAELERVLAENPRCRRAWQYLGELAVAASDTAAARSAFSRLGELAVNRAERAASFAGLARVAGLEGRSGDALALMRKAAAAKPEDPFLGAELARACLVSGDPAAARRAMDRALASRDLRAGEIFSVATEFETRAANLAAPPGAGDGGTAAYAARLMDEAIARAEPVAPRARIAEAAGDAFEASRDFARAAGAYERALAEDTTWSEPATSLAWLALQDPAGTDAARAVTFARIAVSRAPTDAYAWGTLGRASLAAHRPDSAVIALERSRDLLDVAAPAGGAANSGRAALAGTLLRLAEAQEELGRTADARATLDRAARTGLTAEMEPEARRLSARLDSRPRTR